MGSLTLERDLEIGDGIENETALISRHQHVVATRAIRQIHARKAHVTVPQLITVARNDVPTVEAWVHNRDDVRFPHRHRELSAVRGIRNRLHSMRKDYDAHDAKRG